MFLLYIITFNCHISLTDVLPGGMGMSTPTAEMNNAVRRLFIHLLIYLTAATLSDNVMCIKMKWGTVERFLRVHVFLVLYIINAKFCITLKKSLLIDDENSKEINI